jgi:hypothetical protein
VTLKHIRKPSVANAKAPLAANHTCLLEEQIDDGRSLAGMSGHRFLCYELGQERSRLRKIQG